MLTLLGHTDWIRSIDVATYTDTENNSALISGFSKGDLIIASASQDKYIRLWKISEAVASAGNMDTNTKQNNNSNGFNEAIEMLEALVGEEGY